jgi:hypothetical protein
VRWWTLRENAVRRRYLKSAQAGVYDVADEGSRASLATRSLKVSKALTM